MHTPIGPAARCEDQELIGNHAEAAAHGAEVLHLGHAPSRSKAAAKSPDDERSCVALDARPGIVRLDTEDDRIDLVIVTDGPADKTALYPEVAGVRSKHLLLMPRVAPCVAALNTDVEAGPVVHGDDDRGRSFHRHVGGKRRC